MVSMPQPNPNDDLGSQREVAANRDDAQVNPLEGASVNPSLRSTVANNLDARQPASGLENVIQELRSTVANSVDAKPVTPLERRPDGVAVLSLGAPDEKVVTFSVERSAALREALEDLKKNPPKGLVIAGPSSAMFAAGADINAIRTVTDPAIGEKLAQEGQALFNQLASLPCKKVAAISGPCVGGGCEMVLACDVRLISDDPKSQIGLPETQLGILPGWGGTQRLPRLVGLRKGLDIILNAKRLRPEEALKAGLVNEIVPADRLKERAIEIAGGAPEASKASLGFIDRVISAEGFLGSLARAAFGVRSKTLSMIEKKTGGHYPAAPAALDSVLNGLDRGIESGLAFEAKKLGELIASPESKSLVHLFFLTEGAKALGKPGRQKIEQVQTAVVGAGIMGAGIATVLAKSDSGVLLKDISQGALDKGKAHIEASLAKSKRLSAEDRKEIMGRVELAVGDSPVLARCNFAVEAAAERMHIKKAIMADLGEKMPEDAVVATNTSSLSITEIASVVRNPSRVVGMHWFNPPELMPLVEIVRGKQTSDEAVNAVAALATKCGKLPIVVTDVPGFLVNRILTPYMNEVAFLVEEGYDIRDIDKAAKKFGMPMGPVRLLDEVGFDIASHVADTMVQGYGDRMASPPFAKTLFEKGILGKKGGKGFYDYTDPKNKDGVPNKEVMDLLGIDSSMRKEADLKHVERRLILALVNEAVKCLDEGVAGPAARQAACQIDLGTVMGTGFPPFRGGLMRYADSVGAAKLLEELKELEAKHGARYAPSEGIVKRAAQGKGFYEAI